MRRWMRERKKKRNEEGFEEGKVESDEGSRRREENCR